MSDLNFESKLHKGTNFLQLPEEEWPVSKKVETDYVPEKLGKGITTVANTRLKITPADRMNINRFSKYQLLINTTSLILKLFQSFRFINSDKTKELSVSDINKAEVFWFQDAQQLVGIRKVAIIMLCPRYKDDLKDGCP